MSCIQYPSQTNNEPIYTLSSKIEVPGYSSIEKATKKTDDLAKEIIPLQPRSGTSNGVTFTLSSEIEVPGYFSTNKADRLFRGFFPLDLVILITGYCENSVPTDPSAAQLLSAYMLGENAKRCSDVSHMFPKCRNHMRKLDDPSETLELDDPNEAILEIIAVLAKYRLDFRNSTSPVFSAFGVDVNVDVIDASLLSLTQPSDPISKYYYNWYNSSETVYNAFHQVFNSSPAWIPLYQAERFGNWILENGLINDALEDDYATYKPSILINYLEFNNFLMPKEANK